MPAATSAEMPTGQQTTRHSPPSTQGMGPIPVLGEWSSVDELVSERAMDAGCGIDGGVEELNTKPGG